MVVSAFRWSILRQPPLSSTRWGISGGIMVLPSYRPFTKRFPRLREFTTFTIKPGEEPEVVEAEICEDDLPDYTDDPLMGVWADEEDVDLPNMDPKRRMTKIIIDLVNAGGSFNEKIELYREYLTEELLEVFHKRIEFARNFEDEETIEGLRIIWRRIRAELERKSATPAIRLLDELLSILHPSAGGTQQERCRQALGVMYDAFNPAQADGVDIFELAESLAAGNPPPENLGHERVEKEGFICEVKELLLEVKKQRKELIKKRTKLTEEMKEPNPSNPQDLVFAKQLDALDEYLRTQKQSVKDIGVLIEMANTI